MDEIDLEIAPLNCPSCNRDFELPRREGAIDREDDDDYHPVPRLLPCLHTVLLYNFILLIYLLLKKKFIFIYCRFVILVLMKIDKNLKLERYYNIIIYLFIIFIIFIYLLNYCRLNVLFVKEKKQ